MKVDLVVDAQFFKGVINVYAHGWAMRVVRLEDQSIGEPQPVLRLLESIKSQAIDKELHAIKRKYTDLGHQVTVYMRG